ncbi:condensation domain-containing protein [Streptomyces lydicus]|nr:condensation domain-containing protein [Streptomyces lydicus]
MSLSTGATARTASPKERSLWMLDRLVPDAGANNVPAALRIGGRLDRPALRTALTAVVRRHDALRTVFHAADDTLTASVLAPGGTDLDVQEITPSADGPQAALTAFAATPFALDGRPLIRVGLLADGDDDVLCFVVHHLVFDTVSAGVFTRSLARAYARVLRGEQPYPADEGAGPVPVLDEPAPRPQSTDFWRDHLAGFDPGALETDCGTGHNPARPTLAGGRLDHTLTPGATAAVRKLARNCAPLRPWCCSPPTTCCWPRTAPAPTSSSARPSTSAATARRTPSATTSTPCRCGRRWTPASRSARSSPAPGTSSSAPCPMRTPPSTPCSRRSPGPARPGAARSSAMCSTTSPPRATPAWPSATPRPARSPPSPGTASSTWN